MKKRIIKIIVNQPGKILMAFSLLFITAFLMTGLLNFEQDIFKVLPLKNRTFKVLAHALKTSSGQNRIYLLLKGPKTHDALITSAENFSTDLREIVIDGTPAFTQVTFKKIDAISQKDTQELLIQFLNKPELFLTSKDLPRLKKMLTSKDVIETQIQKSLTYYAMPGAGRLAGIAALDPLNARQFMVEKLASLHGGLIFDQGPYLISPDKQSLLIIATPAQDVLGRPQAVKLLDKIDDLRTTYPHLKIGITGGYAVAAQEESLIRGDLLGCLIGSVLGISLLFFFAYRNTMVLIFVLLPLGVGLQLALGTMAIMFDRVHMLAAAFATVILGLGIDFAIHVYDRYSSERQKGMDKAAAIEKSIFKTGSAVLAGGLTTLTAFFVLSFANSPILFQIGWLVALGLLFCLITILWVLPAWLVWIEKYSSKWLSRPANKFYMDKVGQFVNTHPKGVLAFSLILFALSLPGIIQLEFEKDPLAMRPKGLEAVDVQEDLFTSFGGKGEYVLISWQAKDAKDLWEKGHRVDKEMKDLHQSGIISSWTSLSKFSSSDPLRIQGIDLEFIEQVFSKYSLTLTDFKHQYRFLTTLSDTRPPGSMNDPATVKSKDCEKLAALPEMFNRFYICENSDIQGVAWSQVPGPDEAMNVQKHFAKTFPGHIVVSPRLAINELAVEARKGLWTTMTIAGLMVVGILFFFLKSIRSVLLVSLPMVMGLLATAGLMGWMGIRLNLFNFIVLPMLVGIGLDDGIHVLKRYQEIGNVQETLQSTGRSVFLTTLTTICGFGSLILAKYHVLQSMGLLAIFGVLACFVFTVTTLTPLLKLHKHG
jgi:predicted RND superfamily exporter protein